MFLGLLDPAVSQRYGSGSGTGSFYPQPKIVRKTLTLTVIVTYS
jgi:hypothetical protein